MKKYYFIFLIIIFSSVFLFSSCDFTSDNNPPKVYISINLINRTKESILVYAGANIFVLIFPSSTIPPGAQQSIVVEKGETVSFYGQTSHKNYGSRSFYFETQWEIH
jgi:hypothetical protein